MSPSRRLYWKAGLISRNWRVSNFEVDASSHGENAPDQNHPDQNHRAALLILSEADPVGAEGSFADALRMVQKTCAFRQPALNLITPSMRSANSRR
jgi:hypothetical protein